MKSVKIIDTHTSKEKATYFDADKGNRFPSESGTRFEELQFEFPDPKKEREAAVMKIQKSFRISRGKRQEFKAQRKKDKELRKYLCLQAIWQILVTGFEIVKFPTKGRARKRVLWMSIDGRMCLGKNKVLSNPDKYMDLINIKSVTKNNEAPQFFTSLSSREVKGKEHLCMSITDINNQSFAIMFRKHSVRNLLAEQLTQLINVISGDEYGAYPLQVKQRIGRHYAATGDILSLKKIKELLADEEGNTSIADDFVHDVYDPIYELDSNPSLKNIRSNSVAGPMTATSPRVPKTIPEDMGAKSDAKPVNSTPTSLVSSSAVIPSPIDSNEGNIGPKSVKEEESTNTPSEVFCDEDSAANDSCNAVKVDIS